MARKQNHDNLLYAVGLAGIATAGLIYWKMRPAAGEEKPKPDPDQEVGSIQLSTDRIQVSPGENVQLSAIVRDTEGQIMPGVQLHLFVAGVHQEHLDFSNSSGRVNFDLVFQIEGTYAVFVSTSVEGN